MEAYARYGRALVRKAERMLGNSDVGRKFVSPACASVGMKNVMASSIATKARAMLRSFSIPGLVMVLKTESSCGCCMLSPIIGMSFVPGCVSYDKSSKNNIKLMPCGKSTH